FFRAFSSVIGRDRHGRVYGTVGPITKLILTLLAAAVLATRLEAQVVPPPVESGPPSSIKGTVVDARTGSPLPRILVSVEGGPSVETDAEGAFLLAGVAPGQVRLYVSAVGYGLVQRTLTLDPSATLDLRIPLS